MTNDKLNLGDGGAGAAVNAVPAILTVSPTHLENPLPSPESHLFSQMSQIVAAAMHFETTFQKNSLKPGRSQAYCR